MNRRSMFGTSLLAAVGAFSTIVPSRAKAASDPNAPKAVYHLSDIDKPMFVLGNLRNHLIGMGGPGSVRLALVVHGPPLMAFRRKANNDALKQAVGALDADGVAFFACSNTMRGMDLTLEQLLPGFAAAPKGGVVKIAELQGDGWAYLRP